MAVRARPRDRWYRIRIDVDGTLTPAGLRRAHVFAWRDRRGAVERYWASLELAAVAGSASLRAHEQAVGQTEAVLEALAAGLGDGPELEAALARLASGPAGKHEVVAW